jgi:hypothetical protein
MMVFVKHGQVIVDMITHSRNERLRLRELQEISIEQILAFGNQSFLNYSISKIIMYMIK